MNRQSYAGLSALIEKDAVHAPPIRPAKVELEISFRIASGRRDNLRRRTGCRRSPSWTSDYMHGHDTRAGNRGTAPIYDMPADH
jgi:hypothetical protein